MHILFLTPDFHRCPVVVNDAQPFLARQFTDRGHTVTVVTSSAKQRGIFGTVQALLLRIAPIRA